jgi:hypothetical protein
VVVLPDRAQWRKGREHPTRGFSGPGSVAARRQACDQGRLRHVISDLIASPAECCFRASMSLVTGWCLGPRVLLSMLSSHDSAAENASARCPYRTKRAPAPVVADDSYGRRAVIRAEAPNARCVADPIVRSGKHELRKAVVSVETQWVLLNSRVFSSGLVCTLVGVQAQEVGPHPRESLSVATWIAVLKQRIISARAATSVVVPAASHHRLRLRASSTPGSARNAFAAASTVGCPGAAVYVSISSRRVPSGLSIWTARLTVSPRECWRATSADDWAQLGLRLETPAANVAHNSGVAGRTRRANAPSPKLK